MNSYAVNNIIRLTAEFHGPINNLVDPTIVVLFVAGPNGIVNQYAPTRDGVGLYHYDYTTTTPGGRWYYRYQGLGSVPAQTPDTGFNVLIPKF